MQGYSFAEILKGNNTTWPREKVFYEYYWEAAFPQTPTTFAIRTNQYKYIYYNGVWDINELYDLKADPYEMNNLIRDTSYYKTGMTLRTELFNWLQQTGGLQIPLKKAAGIRFDNLYRNTY
jgi:arylsulfatase A-like enzyme